MVTRVELIVLGCSVLAIAIGLYFVQLETNPVNQVADNQTAQVAQSDIVRVEDSANQNRARADAFLEAANGQGEIEQLVIDDIAPGTGVEVAEGDTVTVHYVGRLPDGREFDSSRGRNQPFTFTVGSGQVIQGWEQGLLGMQVGGQRILVIPPELGYGSQPAGPIPPNSTLIFAIELLEIN
jgi:FKBP-type peptidyl-prolyl cis-trans isomerase